jgi:hypothetical protein
MMGSPFGIIAVTSLRDFAADLSDRVSENG